MKTERKTMKGGDKKKKKMNEKGNIGFWILRKENKVQILTRGDKKWRLKKH